MCIIPGFPAALLDDPPQPQPQPQLAAATQQQQQQQQCLSDDEHSPKVRKPYTITKQREKWSDEEHDKFLEAVKLYGRAWRRIEEHVGSKTAVQIRSHAQKFFSKVAKESTTAGGSNSGPAAAAPAMIDIPPPRPKKRPLHPYPRKQGSTPKKRAAAPPVVISVVPPAVGKGSLQQLEESGSPKSVLSAADMYIPALPTAATSKVSGACCACASSDSSITGPNEEEMAHGGGHRNDGASTSSSRFETYDAITGEEAQDDKDPEQAPAQVSFQLFGQTVVVSNPHKPSSSTEASSRLEVTDMPPLSDDSDCTNGGTIAVEADPQDSEILMPTTPAVVSCPFEVLPMLCASLSPPQEQQQQQAAPQPPCLDRGAAAQPLWFFYGGAVALPFVRLPLLPTHHHSECSGMAGDGSADDSFLDSASQQEAPRTPKRTSDERDAEQSGGRSLRFASSHQGSGFVPYKRPTAVQCLPSPCRRE